MSVAPIKTEQARSRRVCAWILRVVVALAFFAAGGARLAGAPFMVQLFAQVGIGQWLRIVTGTVEILGAGTPMHPRQAAVDCQWLGATMSFAALTHLFVIHTAAGAIVLGLLNALIF
jgi:hypothetical protein